MDQIKTVEFQNIKLRQEYIKKRNLRGIKFIKGNKS